jgi:hypothetical protein
MDADINYGELSESDYKEYGNRASDFIGTVSITGEKEKNVVQTLPDLASIQATNNRDNIDDLDVVLKKSDVNAKGDYCQNGSCYINGPVKYNTHIIEKPYYQKKGTSLFTILSLFLAFIMIVFGLCTSTSYTQSNPSPVQVNIQNPL